MVSYLIQGMRQMKLSGVGGGRRGRMQRMRCLQRMFCHGDLSLQGLWEPVVKAARRESAGVKEGTAARKGCE